MRMLLSAFACAPGYGSEPNVGWETVKQVAQRHQVWVLTNAENRPYIEKELSRNPLENATFVYLALPRWIETVAWNPGFHQVYYALWQYRALQIAKQLHKTIRFELVHHVTYVNSWIPPGVAGLGIPFIWNAGTREVVPWRFLKFMSWPQRMREVLRNLFVKSMGAISAQISRRTIKYILSSSTQKHWGRGLPVIPFALGGLSSTEMNCLASIPARNEKPLRVAGIGYFLGLKNFEIGLRAFAQFNKQYPDCEYWLVGQGPEERRLHRLVQELRLENVVMFMPWQSREEIFKLLGEIDILLHPSLHEQFGYVILEAMAAGRAVICLDVAGPSLLVKENCGLKIPLTTPEKVVEDLAAALFVLAEQPALRFQMGENARQHAQETWTWDAVGKRLLALYE